MTIPMPIEALVGDCVGQRCENVVNPHGSILSIDIGPLGRRPDDGVDDIPHGWRHLTVLCPWRLQSDLAVLCDWNVSGGAGGAIQQATQQLIGANIQAAHTAPPGWDLRLEFSNGLTLLAFGDRTESRRDAWFILGTDGAEAGARLELVEKANQDG